MQNYEKRSGPGYNWSMSISHFGAENQTTGYTIDNLDTKKLEEVSGTFEKTFIHIREVLDECYDLDSRLGDVKLDICHQVSRKLSRYFVER